MGVNLFQYKTLVILTITIIFDISLHTDSFLYSLLTTLRLAAYENIARCSGKYFSLPRKLRLDKTTIVSAHTDKNRNSEYSLHIIISSSADTDDHDDDTDDNGAIYFPPYRGSAATLFVPCSCQWLFLISVGQPPVSVSLI